MTSHTLGGVLMMAALALTCVAPPPAAALEVEHSTSFRGSIDRTWTPTLEPDHPDYFDHYAIHNGPPMFWGRIHGPVDGDDARAREFRSYMSFGDQSFTLLPDHSTSRVEATRVELVYIAGETTLPAEATTDWAMRLFAGLGYIAHNGGELKACDWDSPSGFAAYHSYPGTSRPQNCVIDLGQKGLDLVNGGATAMTLGIREDITTDLDGPYKSDILSCKLRITYDLVPPSIGRSDPLKEVSWGNVKSGYLEQ